MPAPCPTAEDRALLDEYIQSLVPLGDGLTLDDFRSQALQQARVRAGRIRAHLALLSAVFLFLTFSVLAAQLHGDSGRPQVIMLSVAAWGFAVGGLGAVANLFLHVMKLAPQPAVVIADTFELYGRILLACLFSTILSITLIDDLPRFFQVLNGQINMTEAGAKIGPLALAPFLFGYSLALVLRILEKIIQAIEITLGVDDRRSPAVRARSTRRQTRRSP